MTDLLTARIKRNLNEAQQCLNELLVGTSDTAVRAQIRQVQVYIEEARDGLSGEKMLRQE
jgi:hypothetical protein